MIRIRFNNVVSSDIISGRIRVLVVVIVVPLLPGAEMIFFVSFIFLFIIVISKD